MDGQNAPARLRARTVMTSHLPGPDWRWLGLRRRCRFCGQRYPCPPHRRAFDLLSGRA